MRCRHDRHCFYPLPEPSARSKLNGAGDIVVVVWMIALSGFTGVPLVTVSYIHLVGIAPDQIAVFSALGKRCVMGG